MRRFVFVPPFLALLLIMGCQSNSQAPESAIDEEKLAQAVAEKVAEKVAKETAEKTAEKVAEKVSEKVSAKLDDRLKELEKAPDKTTSKADEGLDSEKDKAKNKAKEAKNKAERARKKADAARRKALALDKRKKAQAEARARAKAREKAQTGKAEATGGQTVNQDRSWLENSSSYETQAGKNPAVGPDEALVKVFIISDFQCPVCRRAANGVETLFPEFDKKVQWVFWQNPLDMHRRADIMARASMAAFKQGKFWQYHDKLFANKRSNRLEDLVAMAEELGLDTEKFKEDMKSPSIQEKILSDKAVAVKLKARGTPSFAVNGRIQVGWGSANGIRGMVRRELTAMEKLMESGKTREEALKERARANAKTEEIASAFIDHMLEGKKAK